uniref:Neuromedin-U receptor 2-like n=1 Tax=Crassostrea virginica TaxID=6565 RepID=A0A8B8CM45_CRAVI|nr:neuromedin-U receptor 2-like [Crassostrea virginica]
MNTTNSSAFQNVKTLEELNNEKAHQRLPAVVFLSILIVVGITGNIIVLVAYSRKYRLSTFRTFILTLAVVDLSSCLIGMPMELVDNLYPLTFYNEEFCKIGKFLGQILKIGSALIVFLMAVVRYQKICLPTKTYFSNKVARNLCIISMFVAVFLSWPFLILQGTQYKHYDGGVVGHDCSVDSDVKDTIYPFVYTIITFAFYMFVFFGLLILYTLIILNLRRHNELEEQRHKIDSRITKIMIAITVAFVVSYLPDCILDANSTFNKRNTLPPSPAVLGSLPLLARAYFINNVINPIIYFVGDTKFRKIMTKAFVYVIHIIREKQFPGSNHFELSDTLKTEDHTNTTTKNSSTITNNKFSSADNSEL